MRLREVLTLLEPDAPGADVAFTCATEDSRRVRQGALFVAARGAGATSADGHDFAEQAERAGAVVILGDRPGLREWAGLPYVWSEQPRRDLGVVAHRLMGDPTGALRVMGVTGTNGKTSTVTLTSRVLTRAGLPTAAFGTLGYVIGDEVHEAKHTTPFAEDLAWMFARARDAGMTHVAMEVSSHALEQERVAGIAFRAAAFTNLTQDHLDYHPDMEAYLRAKLRLFERVGGEGAFTVVNLADPRAGRFVEASPVPVLTYGTDTADCRARDVRMNASEATFTADTPWGRRKVRMRLLGLHNVSNALCATALCGGMGVSLEAVAEALAEVESIPGRFEHVWAGQDFQVVVDYAHTDDGLRNVLRAARAICTGRIITVFGCGGDRDKGKRPKMAQAVAELSDYAILTSDNPRSEDPARILLDIEVGMQRAGKQKGENYELVEDRAEAIRRGIGLARRGDLVLIAGKGHETYQILGDRRIHFDDREQARAALEAR